MLMNKQILENKTNKTLMGFNKIAVFIVALILATAIISQGNFLEGLLKLLGVGAATQETIDEKVVREDLMISDQSQIAKEIIIDYNELSITNDEKGSVRINVASNGKLIAQLDEVILSARSQVVFEDIELSAGEQYVVVLETPFFDNKILYFSASYLLEDSYNFTFGRFYSTGLPTNNGIKGDFNGDGVINDIDYAQFIELWQNFQNENSINFVD